MNGSGISRELVPSPGNNVTVAFVGRVSPGGRVKLKYTSPEVFKKCKTL